MKLKKFLFPIVYSIVLIAFTIYVLLDTFVIVRVYEPIIDTNPSFSSEAESKTDTPDSETEEPNDSDTSSSDTDAVETDPPEPMEPIITEDSYIDSNISIMLSEYRQYGTVIYVADIEISSPEYLKTALARNSYGKNITEKTSVMAKNNGAIIAVNGDFYGAREKGYVMRNGVLYRDKPMSDREALVIYRDGSMDIVSESFMSAERLVNDGAMHILSFGPGLVINGDINVDEKDEVAVASKSNPRTAIGIIDDLHYVLVVSDGRTAESEGLSLLELAEFLQGMGAHTAYNLDGGGSATMWFNGRVINKPTTDGKNFQERSVSDIVYIGY